MLFMFLMTAEIRVVNAQPQLPVSAPGNRKADADGNGIVDGLDYVIWLRNYKNTRGNGPHEGDFNADGKVDGRDYVVWLNSFNGTST